MGHRGGRNKKTKPLNKNGNRVVLRTSKTEHLFEGLRGQIAFYDLDDQLASWLGVEAWPYFGTITEHGFKPSGDIGFMVLKFPIGEYLQNFLDTIKWGKCPVDDAGYRKLVKWWN